MTYIILSICAAVWLYTACRNATALQEDPPRNLQTMVAWIEQGIIPPELQLMIPAMYEEREDCTMQADLDRTLLDRSSRPMWTLTLSLCDGFSTSRQTLLYDSNGDLYQ